VEQTLENQPTAYLGWDPFGDVVLKTTAREIRNEKKEQPSSQGCSWEDEIEGSKDSRLQGDKGK
jgi:hypothetical protein